MNNLQFAISIALANNQNFILNSNIINQLPYDFNTTTIDLKSFNLDRFINDITEVHNDNKYFKEIVILEGLQNLSLHHQKQLVTIIDEINEYDRNDSRANPKDYVIINGIKVYKTDFHIFIGITNNQQLKLNKNLKEQFWFSHFYLPDNKPLVVIQDYKNKLLVIRNNVDKVYQSPEITAYIYSLMIHIRNHRLNTINQIQTRLHTNVIDKVSRLAKSIVAWSNYEAILSEKFELFIVPDTIKMSVRKICYWLVDWETNQLFMNGDEQQKKVVINMLIGEWYGSEWKYVKQYMEGHGSKDDERSSTGFSNGIIEDVIGSVKPPI